MTDPQEETKKWGESQNHFVVFGFFLRRLASRPFFPPPKSNSQPAPLVGGSVGLLGGYLDHLEDVHSEDPTSWHVDVGGFGDVDDSFGAGAGDVVVVGFISAVEAGLQRGATWGI